MQPAKRETKCGFKAGDAVRRVLKLDFLFVNGVGRVVGSDGVHHAVEDGLDHGIPVRSSPQRRIHLGVGIVEADMLFGEQEVVRSHLAGDAQSTAPSLAHCGERGSGRSVGHMQMGAGIAQFSHQADVALDHSGLGFRRHSAQSELERHRPQVHAGALSEPRVFSMLNDAQPHARRRGQGLAHDVVFEDGVAVVGDSHSAGGFERRIVVERLAFRSAGSSGNREDANHRAAFRRLHPARDLRRVVHRTGVGHGCDSSEPARSR